MCFIAMSIALALVACLLNLIEVDSMESQSNLGKRDPEAGPSQKTQRCYPPAIISLVGLCCGIVFGVAAIFCKFLPPAGLEHEFETAAKALGGIACVFLIVGMFVIMSGTRDPPGGTSVRQVPLNNSGNAAELQSFEIAVSLNPTRRSSAISIAPHILAALMSIAAMALFLAVLKQRSRTRVNAAAAVQKV